MLNALTINVEDYFHPTAMQATVTPPAWDTLPARVERNTHRILDLLDEHRVGATFFALGWVAERWPALVDEIARRGHLHPWEFDVDQPRLAARTTARIRQYTNLHRTEPRARLLLRRFRFAPIREALSFADLPVADVPCPGGAGE